MDSRKEIEFSLEFIKRVVQRGVLGIFDNDLEKCCKEVERKMREESVIIENPNEKYPNQNWCIINIEGVGLAKIPFSETPRYIKAITIACPVTDKRCIDSFNSRTRRKRK